MRKFLLYAHLSIGLVAGIFLFLLGATGAVLVFEDPIDHWMNRELVTVSPSGPLLTLDELKARLEGANPGAKVVGFELPQRDGVAYLAALRSAGPNGGKELIVDPHDGRVMGNVDQLSDVMPKIHGFHTHLSSLLGTASKPVLGWSSVGLFVLASSGIILWWPRKIFSWTMTSSGRRLIFDMHNALGFYSAIFLALFSLTGAAINWEQKVNGLATKMSTQEQRVEQPKPAPGAAMLGPAELLNIAQSAVPGARVTLLQFLPGRPARAQMKFPEDHTPAGRSSATIDAYSGKVLQATSSRDASVAVKYARMWNREIHTGDIWGWPTRIIAFFFSLVLCVMTVSGPIIWWNRQGRQLFKRGSEKQAMAAASED